MVVVITDCASEKIRGNLTKWFLELKPGVFVGNINARVRELVWQEVVIESNLQGAILIYSDSNEQGFSMKMTGFPKRQIIDLDGLKLVKVSESN